MCVSVSSQTKTSEELYEKIDECRLSRYLEFVTVPCNGDHLEYSDCGRRVELGTVRRIVHVTQPYPSPFREPDEPRVEVSTCLFTSNPEAAIERLKGVRFKEVALGATKAI